MATRKKPAILQKLMVGFLLSVAFVMVFSGLSPAIISAEPLPESEVKALDQWKNWIAAECATDDSSLFDIPTDLSGTQPGAGAPDGATYPNLSAQAMAGAIDKWVIEQNPQTKMKGLGSTIVADGKHANVSPFLIVGIARMESAMADPQDYNVEHGNNSFGRTATQSQPHFQGAMTWYKWSSVKASVNYAAPENQGISGGGDIGSYIRNQYASLLNGSLLGFFQKYSDNSALYASNVQGWIDELVKLSGKNLSPDAPTAVGSPDACCPSDGSESTPGAGTGLKGKAAAKYIFDTLVGKGLEPFQAAGVLGNMEVESAGTFNPQIVQGGSLSKDPASAGSGGYGLVQWTPGSKLKTIISEANIKGYVYDLDPQIDALWAQLTGKTETYNETAAGDLLKASGDVASATTAFMRGYERPADQSDAAAAPRTAAARAYLTQYGSGASPMAAGGGADGGGVDASLCCPPTAVDGGDVQDGSPADWKKMYTGGNKDKAAGMGHGKIDPKILVIHYTVGPQEGQALLDFFAAGGLGIQFNVGKDGTVYQYFALNDMQETYHVGDANSKAIGIEITGRDVNELLNNQKQFDAVASLSKFLCDRYKIPCSDSKGDMTGDGLSTAQGMLGHDETPTNDHNDPDAKYGQTIDRGDSSKHPYMIKLRTALGFDPTPGKKGGAASPGTVADPAGGATETTEGCSVAADNVSGNGTKDNPVGEGANKALALEAVRYDTKTTRVKKNNSEVTCNDKDTDCVDKYYYKWGGLHGAVSQLKAFAKDGGGTDCSGFVRYIIWRVYGEDVGSFVTGSLPSMPGFKKVDPSDAQAGDIGWTEDHVDFITDNKGGGKLHEFGAHSENTNLHGGPATTDSYQAYYRYVGPKSGERN